ncbi:MAG: 4-alpha-glucanotransferase, partial [Candidatus Competibacterales bacterium]
MNSPQPVSLIAMASTVPRPHPAVEEALSRLGVDKLVFAIHDQSFPSAPGQDPGRGSPYGAGGRALMRWLRRMGFNGIQLGPQGLTTWDNPSPYDAALFPRNPLSLDLHALLDGDLGWLDPRDLDRLLAANPHPGGDWVAHRPVFAGYRRLLEAYYRRFCAGRAHGDPRAQALAAELDRFWTAQHRWLPDAALYQVMARTYGDTHHRHWPAEGAARLDPLLGDPPSALGAACRARRQDWQRRAAADLEAFGLVQYLIHHQHASTRQRANAWGLHLYGDLQVGLSPGDLWRWGRLFLGDYHLGAPPSRTNPAGQACGYGVLDPAGYSDALGGPGPVVGFLQQRVGKLLDEFDGLRLDHPHGLVCPWVYRRDDPNPEAAVQGGARLFSSPDLPDHPELAAYAIPRPGQLNPAVPRHADGWVRDLGDDQLARYSVLVDAIMAEAAARGLGRDGVICEVLSTRPYPLARVMERHGLGRFRVTQKARRDDPQDVYRSDNAQPEDWIMLGNHDTPSIWAVVAEWRRDGKVGDLANHLAAALGAPDPEGYGAVLARDDGPLVHALFAELLLSPARQVMVFFADVFGLVERYNAPGTVGDHNWSLRLSPDAVARYPEWGAVGGGGPPGGAPAQGGGGRRGARGG